MNFEEPSVPGESTGMEQPVDQAPPAMPRRIPNLGHAVVFVAFVGFLLLALEFVLAMMGKSPATMKAGAMTVQHPKLEIAIEAGAYLGAVAAAWFLYPLWWGRTFLDGIQWHWATARDQASKLMGLGVMLGLMMQIVLYFTDPPKTQPISEFFLSPGVAWLVTGFGAVVAPVFEEVCFRGFLLPAFAIAYDWLTLPRTDEGRAHWRTTTSLTPGGLMFSAILSSLLFASIHGPQYAYYWASMVAVFAISLLLTYVRWKSQSVAASALVHATYNSFVFLLGIIATGGYRHLDRLAR